MDNSIKNGLVKYRLEQAKTTLHTAEKLFSDEDKDFVSVNNWAYYAIFYAIRADLFLEEKYFKRHKDVIAYFNKNYVNTEVFPKKLGRKIAQAQYCREKSDYDGEYTVKEEKVKEQLETAKEVVELIEKYLNENLNK